jgi:hypothetical protein
MKSLRVKTALLSLIVAGTISAAASPAVALTPMECGNYKISAVGVASNADLLVSLPTFGDHLFVCNVNSDYYGWTATACRAFQSSALAAMLSGKVIFLDFDASKKPSCTAVSTWTNLSTQYGLYNTWIQ